MIVRVAIATGLLLWSAAAGAQPSFDCAKASNVVERRICADPKLAKADRDLATVYGALSAKLSGAAKDHLVKDQLRWLANRAKACTGEPGDVARCVRLRYDARIAILTASAEGQYPFVSEQTLLRTGKVRMVRYEIDASYPQFDGGTADFSGVNKAFANAALQAAKEATPEPDAGDRDQTWTYLQSFKLYRPGPNSVTVATTFYTFTGGAHGSSGVAATLIDLGTGRKVLPAGAFLPTAPWEGTIAEIARADLEKQFVERPGFDDALEPAKFAKLLKDPERYLFKAGALELIFNQYDVGPYAAGPYTVVIPYTKLTALIRPDGPVGR